MEEQIIKEWKRKGKTDRDWTKLNVLVFDENSKIKVKSLVECRNEQKAIDLENANSVIPQSKK